MATYYVGSGGNNSNDGLTWANRKLTLNGAEDIPVVAGDTVIVAPGVYRETLTTDVSGTSGNPITYVGDEGGTLTDGVGGAVRISGSDDDLTAVRSPLISLQHNYRTFRGIRLEGTSSNCISAGGVTDAVIEQCVLLPASNGIVFNGAGQARNIIRRCLIIGASQAGIQFTHSSTISDSDQEVENLIFIHSGTAAAVRVDRVGGIVLRNCEFSGAQGVRVQTALAGGQTVEVYNSLFVGCGVSVQATVTGELVEDYNAFWSGNLHRSNVNTGANSNTYLPLYNTPLLTLGERGFMLGDLIASAGLNAIAGAAAPTDDLYGVTRESPSSWGAVQYRAGRRPVDVGEPRGRRG